MKLCPKEPWVKVVIYQPFPLKEQSWRFVAFETLITFLTIENNNLNVQTDSIRKTLGQESRFRKLFCFLDVCLVEFADWAIEQVDNGLIVNQNKTMARVIIRIVILIMMAMLIMMIMTTTMMMMSRWGVGSVEVEAGRVWQAAIWCNTRQPNTKQYSTI